MSANAPPPSVALLRLMTGAWISHAIWLAARLGIADRLAERPQDSDELARATGMYAPALHRVLRALASVGIFREVEHGRFALTALAELLQSGVPGSLRDFGIMLGEAWHWRAWGELPESARTGQSFFERAHGMTCFDYWAQGRPTFTSPCSDQ